MSMRMTMMNVLLAVLMHSLDRICAKGPTDLAGLHVFDVPEEGLFHIVTVFGIVVDVSLLSFHGRLVNILEYVFLRNRILRRIFAVH